MQDQFQQLDHNALTHVTGGLSVTVRSGGAQGAPQPQMQPGGGAGGGGGQHVRVHSHGGGHVNISIRQG
jgi:hypothetical protein